MAGYEVYNNYDKLHSPSGRCQIKGPFVATTKNIQSVERAFSILELFAAGSAEMSLKEIAAGADLNKSTAFGLVNTLASLGYLHQNDSNQKYTLGLKVLSLSNLVKVNSIIIRTVHPHLERLSHKFKETAHCAVESGDSVTYIDKVEAPGSIYINTQIGTKNYMHCTGVGKCMLAYSPEAKQQRILSGNLKTMTYNTITNAERLKEELVKIRQRAYATDDEEIEIGLSCIAVPVFAGEGYAAFAISLSGLTQRINGPHRQEMIEQLQQEAAAISRELYTLHAV